MTTFKSHLKTIVPLKEAEGSYFKQFAGFLEKYEEAKNAKSNEVGALVHVRLVSGEGGNRLKDKLDNLVER